MLNAMDWQHISKDEFIDLIKSKILHNKDIEVDGNNKLHIFTGILGDCDIELEVDFIDAIRFFPGG